MRNKYTDRFAALRDRDRVKHTHLRPPDILDILHPIGKLQSNHKLGTIGYFADRMRQRPARLIAILERAGIHGLTPNHYFDESAKEKLLAFLRAEHRTEAQSLYTDNSEIASKIVVVQSINEELLKQLSTSPKLMHTLESRKFEELVARLLEDQGCEVTLTKRTRDGGYDVLGRMKSGPADLLFLAECKRYAPENKVGVEVVRGLYGVTEAHRANLGLVITTSTFTRDAREEKLRIGPRIDLKEYSDLCAWLAPYRGAA
jgi:restriction system protein